MLYCHSDFTRGTLHAAWMAISPWFMQMVQCNMFASRHFLLNLPLVAWSCPMTCCSWKAINASVPMSSAGPGMGPLHWTWAPFDHWEIPDTSVLTTNLHVGIFQIVAWAFINAFLHSSTALGHWKTWASVSWNFWHLGHLLSMDCSILWRLDIVANRANSSLKSVSLCPGGTSLPALDLASQSIEWNVSVFYHPDWLVMYWVSSLQ